MNRDQIVEAQMLAVANSRYGANRLEQVNPDIRAILRREQRAALSAAEAAGMRMVGPGEAVAPRVLMDQMGAALLEVNDHLQDEGDRVFFGSTNHADRLKDAAQAWFERRYLEGERNDDE